MDRSHLVYVDRRTGAIKQDPIHAPRFLAWSYNARGGWLLTNLVFSRRRVSRLYGWAARRRWSRRRIQPFAEAMGVDLSELVRPISAFRSFSDFITREIDLATRPIDRDPNICVSPVDGRLLAYPLVDSGAAFPIKRAIFDLRTFLGNERLVRSYAGGSMVVIRLYLADYHHFHFPADGIPQAPTVVPGRYFAVTPYSMNRLVPFFGENYRMITLFESDRFGPIAIVEVGAFTVGSIRQDFVPGRPVAKGDHKGCFDLGASIVVLLFKRGTIRLDGDLCANSRAGLETYVRLGEPLGRVGTGGGRSRDGPSRSA